MRIFVSINGVLRNFIEKFDYHYQDYFLNSEVEDEKEDFEYKVVKPIENDKILNSYFFQDVNEFNNFLYVDFPIEIFGHARTSYQNVFLDLNNLIHNTKNKITVVGLNELGKSKPATLFFLSKNGFMGRDIKFIYDTEIDDMWNECDVWVTDDIDIIKSCPKHKKVIKFKTKYNQHFTSKYEIDKLTDINDEILCLKSLTNIITLISIMRWKFVRLMRNLNLMVKKQ
jgi:hypothetical protein